MAAFEEILLLAAAVVALAWAARRLALPTAAALVLGGLALALAPVPFHVRIGPELILALFLPPLLLSSAYFTVWRDFRANLRIIAQLAVGAVALTTLAVGAAVHAVAPGLPWAACFALGAIVSPPDAVSAKAALETVKLPPRVLTLLEGESLVNDATGLVLYKFAVAAALGGAFDLGAAVGQFAVLAAGGVGFGIAAGFAFSFAVRRIEDDRIAILATFIAAWASYFAADRLGVSGVLAVVACGIVLGWRQHADFSARRRMQAEAVWDSATFVLESLIFVLIGLSLRDVVERADPTALARYAAVAGVTVATVVAARFLWVLPATYLPRALIPALRRRDPFPTLAIPIVMGWAGMRGVVSLAAALALPATFPGRDAILVATFAVILVTVLVQGVTLGPLVRCLRPSGFALAGPALLTETEARAAVADAQRAALKARCGDAPTPAQLALIDRYARRAGVGAEPDTPDRLAWLDAVAAGRRTVLKLHRDGRIHDAVLRALEHDLDLEEIAARQP